MNKLKEERTLKETLYKLLKNRRYSIDECNSLTESLIKDKELAFCIISKVGTCKEEEENPFKSAIWTFTSFALFGFLPLLTYIISPYIATVLESTISLSSINLYISTSLALLTLYILGRMKSTFSSESSSTSLKTNFQMVIVGGSAALIAYWIAWSMSPNT